MSRRKNSNKTGTTAKKKASERTTTQIQVYLPPQTLADLDTDCAEREQEIRAEMGPSRPLSRSAHVVSIIHNYLLAKAAFGKASAKLASRDLWERITAVAGLSPEQWEEVEAFLGQLHSRNGKRSKT